MTMKEYMDAVERAVRRAGGPDKLLLIPLVPEIVQEGGGPFDGEVRFSQVDGPIYDCTLVKHFDPRKP